MRISKHSNYSDTTNEAILLMDIQPRLLSSIENSESLLDASSILLKSAELLEMPIIITEQVPQKLGRTHPDLLSACKNPNLIEKDTFSAFGSSEFCELIGKLRINKLIIAGIETPICIFLTALHSLHTKIDVSIIYDCLGCRIKNDGEKSLVQLMHLGAEIIPLETFLFNKLQSSGHPNFKDISELIKSRI